MRRLRPPRLASVVAVCVAVLPLVARAAPPLVTVTFVGTAATETVRAVAIAGDGSVVAAITTYERVTQGTSESWRAVATRLARFDRDVTKQLWSQPLPEPVSRLKVDAADDVYALGTTRLYKVKLADGATAATSEAFTGSLDLSVLPSGSAAVLAGGRVLRFSATLEKTGETAHGIQTPFALLLDRDGGVYVSGDYNPGTGCEPYRVPILRHFTAAGERDWRFHDYPGQLARLAGTGSLESDSSIRGLSTDARGRLWFRGWSDGLNTMLRFKHWNPKEKNPYIDAACFPGVCPYPRGARTYMMAARLLDTYDEVGAATWWQAANQRPVENGGAAAPGGIEAWLATFPLCGCRPHPYATTTSTFIDGLASHGGEAVFWGSSDEFPPASPDAWFGTVVKDAHVFVGITDESFQKGRFGAAIPGASAIDGRIAGDLRGGRLVLAGAATAALPAKAPALQPQYAGGMYDGFLLVACVGTAAECGGPMPPVPAAVKPVIRPVPALPTLSRCSKDAAGKVVPAQITSGAMPDFGIDYSMATPAARDGGAAAVDAAAAVEDARPPFEAPGAAEDAPRPGVDAASRPVDAARPSGDPGVRRDASAPDEPPAPAPRKKAGGCAVASSPPPAALSLLAIVALVRRRRRPARR